MLFRKIINIYFENHIKLNSAALVRKGSMQTEWPPLVGEVSVKFCG
jgi:hypothetical protein